MRYRDGRRSLCLSSQSGCPLTCTFCATGAMRFGRNLTASEIVDQALHFRRREEVNHAVYMGMGEPLLNVDAVLASALRLPDLGITHRRTTISTVGWMPGLRRFVDEIEQPIRLAVSVHAADPEKRSELMPVQDRYPLADVLAECRRYVELRRRKVFVEYVMLAGVNDSAADAKALAAALDARAFKVNLIPYNPIRAQDRHLRAQMPVARTTEGGTYAGSSREAIERFKGILERARIPATVRLTRGRDIEAACGQLAAAMRTVAARSRRTALASTAGERLPSRGGCSDRVNGADGAERPGTRGRQVVPRAKRRRPCRAGSGRLDRARRKRWRSSGRAGRGSRPRSRCSSARSAVEPRDEGREGRLVPAVHEVGVQAEAARGDLRTARGTRVEDDEDERRHRDRVRRRDRRRPRVPHVPPVVRAVEARPSQQFGNVAGAGGCVPRGSRGWSPRRGRRPARRSSRRRARGRLRDALPSAFPAIIFRPAGKAADRRRGAPDVVDESPSGRMAAGRGRASAPSTRKSRRRELQTSFPRGAWRVWWPRPSSRCRGTCGCARVPGCPGYLIGSSLLRWLNRHSRTMFGPPGKLDEREREASADAPAIPRAARSGTMRSARLTWPD